MFNFLNFVSGQIFQSIGKIKVYTFIREISAVLNIGLSIILLRVMGVVGIVLTTAI